MRPLTNSRGFTLLELLTVVLIIGVLASIALLGYKQVLDRAKRSRSLAAAESIRSMMLTYNIDNRAFPAAFDPATCVDENGNTVFKALSCDAVKNEISRFESYQRTVSGFELKLRALDRGQTVLTVTESTVSF